MGLRAWNVGVVVASLGLFLAGGTQREKPILSAERADAVRALEADSSVHPLDAAKLRTLAEAYLEARAPGLAILVIEEAQSATRATPKVQHVYARALLEQGRAADALSIERGVLSRCESEDCETWLIASATRRADILAELVLLGVEDAQAHPESAAIAYHNATREARLAIR